MLQIAICDDSRADVEILEKVLNQFQQYPITYDVFFSAEELLHYHKKQEETYHLYFFDIEMPDKNGLELAKEIRKYDQKALFIFLTGYTEYVMDVFEVTTFYYLSKPITIEKLEPVLVKAIKYLDLVRQDFLFKFRKDQFRINFEEILYFEKRGRRAYIHTIKDVFETNMTIEAIWKQLDEKMFCHIHVSYIINLQHIQGIRGDEVYLDQGEHFFIARTHKQELREKHLDFVRRMM